MKTLKLLPTPGKEGTFHVYSVTQQIFAKLLCLYLHDPWSMINSLLFSLRLISRGIIGSVPFTLQSEDVMHTSSYFSLVVPILSIWSLNVSLCSLLLF